MKAKTLLTAIVLGLTAVAAHAQNPECRYYTNQSARGWAQGGYQAYQGNAGRGFATEIGAARNLGRAGYFCSPTWDQNRGAVTRSPYWNNNTHYFQNPSGR